MAINWNTYGTGSKWDSDVVERPWHKDGLVAPEIRKYLTAQGFSGPFENATSEERAYRPVGSDGRGSDYTPEMRNASVRTGSQELTDWLKAKGLTLQSGATVEGGDQSAYVSRLMDGGGNMVASDQYNDSKSNLQKIAPMIAVGGLAAMTGGALAPLMGGLLGAGSMAAGAATGAGAGAVGGGLSAGMQGKDIGQGILKGGLMGAAGGGLGAGLGGLNAAGAMGVENSVGQGLVNGAIKGGATAALKGQGIGQGLLGGAISGGAGSAWNAAGGLSGIGSALGGSGNGDGSEGFDGNTGGGNDMDFGDLFGGDGGYDWGNVDMFPSGGAGFDFGGQDLWGNFAQVPELDYSQLLSGGHDWGNVSLGDGSFSASTGTPTGSPGLAGLGSSIVGGLGNLLGGAAGAVGGGGNLAALIGAGLGATQGGKQQTATLQQQIDPRMAQYLYGSGYGDQNSFLGAAQKQFQANPSGMNETMTQGMNMQRAALTDPAYGKAYTDMRAQGGGLMNMQAAGNPFTQAGGIAQAGGVGGLLGESGPDRIQALMQRGRGLLGQ